MDGSPVTSAAGQRRSGAAAVGKGDGVGSTSAMSDLVIAVDGPSGSGKSTAARGVAAKLALRYLDTGAMYRAMTWWMLEHGVDVNDPDEVAARSAEPLIRSGTDPLGATIHVGDVDVSRPVRGRAVTSAVSAVSAVPQVRSRLVDLQRRIIGAGGIVVEGRDIGSVVVPDAPVKVYLTASASTRAERRTAELAGATVEATRREMERRDRFDSTRAITPLAVADGAVVLDTTELDLDEVVETIIGLAVAAVGAPSS
jgi:cytidylate kinase